MLETELYDGLIKITEICAELMSKCVAHSEEQPTDDMERVIKKMGNLIYVDFKKGKQIIEPPKEETFGDFLTYWYNKFVLKGLRPSTRANYEDYIFKKIIPVLGDIVLTRLSPDDLEMYFSGIDRENTKFKHGFLINRALTKAVALGKIQRNPFAALESMAHSAEHYRHLEFDEQNAMLEYLSEPCRRKYYAVFNILCCTGLRIGEFLALDFEKDVDWENNVIRVTKTKDTRTGVVYVWTKSDAGRREIPILPELKPYFDIIRKVKRPFTYSGVRSCFRRAYARLGIEKTNQHSFRHTFLSLCYLAGIKPKFIQVIAGHSKIEMTLNVYTHMLKKGNSPILDYIRRLAAYIEESYV